MNPILQRFWSKVDKNGPTPKHQPKLGKCWIWKAGKVKQGYGRFYLRHRKETRAHRFSLGLVIGNIPKNKMACHHCDNPPCVNPTHLFKSNAKGNTNDAKNKHRLATGENNGMALHPQSRRFGLLNGHYTKPLATKRGELHGRAKLTTKQVLQIRRLYKPNIFTIPMLMRKFKVSHSTIAGIVQNRYWKTLLPNWTPLEIGNFKRLALSGCRSKP